MPDDFNNRLKASKKLESATTALIKTAHKLRTKAEKAAEKNGQPLEDKWTATPSGNETEGSIAERLVPEKKRPTHKLPSPKWMPFALPFLGTKVDTINWCKDQIVEHDKNLESKREQLRRDIKTPGTGDDETYPPLNSAFVLFNQQIGAHLACQSLIHNEPYAMSGRYIETAPADVICTCPPELLQLGDCPLMSLLVDDSHRGQPRHEPVRRPALPSCPDRLRGPSTDSGSMSTCPGTRSRSAATSRSPSRPASSSSGPSRSPSSVSSPTCRPSGEFCHWLLCVLSWD
jgi:hypothetical protein